MIAVSISKTFSASTKKLSTTDRGRVLDFLTKFMDDPSSPGLNFETLQGAKDTSLKSARITQDLRTILHQSNGTLTLLYAGHHEDAYRWAERRRIENHPVTGTLQIVETADGIQQEMNVTTSTSPAPRTFAGYDDSYLLSLGVPADWLTVIRQIENDDQLLTVCQKLPEEVSERLMVLSTGELVTPPPPVPASAPITQNPDNLRRFWVVQDAAELTAILDRPIEDWVRFLHPSQRLLVTQIFNGPVKVSGAAGTGKTVVGMHRARRLASQGKRVLLTSFVTTLCRNIERNIHVLCSGTQPMTLTPYHLTVTEWERRSPATDPQLANRWFGSTGVAHLAEQLTQQGRLTITELRTGLEVRARSHVGTVQLGDLSVSIRPKLNQSSLLNLLRYAYGFRELKLFDETTQRMEHVGFEDLLVSQLNAEVTELLARGLQRNYVARHEYLASPRGRIDISRITSDGGVTACLPCTHHPRIEDTLLNRVLLAGLLLAADVATDVSLKRQSHRLAAILADGVRRLRLDTRVLDRLADQMTRLTVAYEAAIVIIRLLVESRGVSFDGAESSTPFPGFLFDMNRFFQALLSRFLGEYLTDCTVRDEHQLRGMLQYAPGFNPRHLSAPIPRPDFVIEQHGHVVTILDAKYRDLWVKELPREMLYQLALYATSHAGNTATILYPTTDVLAREARLIVRDPMRGSHLAMIRLSPVLLGYFEELVFKKPTAMHQRSCRDYARKLAFGNET